MKYRNLKIHLLVAVLIVVLLPFNTVADPLFNSGRIKRIYASLPVTLQDKIRNLDPASSRFYLLEERGLNASGKLAVRFNSFNELEHIGLYLIRSKNGADQYREVFDFLERTLMQYALTQDLSSFFGSGELGYITLLENGNEIKSEQKVPVTALLGINDGTPFKLDANSREFMASWSISDHLVLSMKFPNNISQITEKTKDELERDLIRQIRSKSLLPYAYVNPPLSKLEHLGNGLYILKGESYNQTEGISSNTFFMAGDSVKPVFDKKHYRESVSNLFLGLISQPVKLDMVHKMYGGVEEKYTTNVTNFIGNFSVWHKIYFGWQNDDRNNLKATVIFVNGLYNYTHLLVIESSTKNIFNGSGTINGTFYAYTPKNNLK